MRKFKPKTYKTVGGVVRSYEDRLGYMRAQAHAQGKPFDWTTEAIPAAQSILRQILAPDVKPDEIPSENLAQWITDLQNTEIGKKRANDLKKVSALLRGPRVEFIGAKAERWGTTVGGIRVSEK
jgi:hypothetical protein